MQYKRVITYALTSALVIGCIIGDVLAVSSSVTDYYNLPHKTVSIHIDKEETEESDFVRAFPEIVMEKQRMNLRPPAELEFQERKEYVSVPLYFQTDYPETLYGEGTVESSGCSITSIAMVASYMTGYEYLPDELAYYFGGRAESNQARMFLAADTLGLTYDDELKNIDETIDALKEEESRCAIVLMGANSDFTNSQHYIVFTGLKEVEAGETTGETIPETTEETIPESEKEYRILVNDSYAPNYENPNLADGFENGFHPDVFHNDGFQGAWIFDKSQMPEEIKRYFEPEPVPVDDRYADIELSFAERQLLAKVIWAEARGESAEGQQAVAEVVLNRILSENFPEDVRDIIYQEGQFRTLGQLLDAEPTQAQYQAIENAFYGPYMLTTDVVYFASYPTNDNVYIQIGGHIFCGEELDPQETTEPD